MTKVLHVFYEFLPHVNGSTVRSSALLVGQRTRGIDVAAVSSPFQRGFTAATVEDYRGIRVHRAYQAGMPAVSDAGSSVLARATKIRSFPTFVSFIVATGRAERASVIHAHSTFYCALAGYLAARRLGVPLVYEFRSIWEERAKLLGMLYRIQAHVGRLLETASFHLADRVVAINEGLRQDVVRRGVPSDKVIVAPNGVDDELLTIGRRAPPPSTIRRFGYIGTYYSNEGLDVLIDGFRLAFPRETDVRLIFRGTGPYEPQLREHVSRAQDSRIQVGAAFKREDIASAYDELDCVVLPRRRNRLNDTVTPLKPLEAMAFGRLVGISDVGGLLEVVGSSENAWVFAADNVQSLASGLRDAYNGRFDVRGMAERGRQFVERERAWSAIAERYVSLYAGLPAHSAQE